MAGAGFDSGPEAARVTDPVYSDPAPVERYLENLATAFAVTRGASHALVYANAAFRRLQAAGGDSLRGRPIADALGGVESAALVAVLDRARRTGRVERDQVLASTDPGGPPWNCTVWSALNRPDGEEHLMIELRPAGPVDPTLTLQRDVAERMLLSALRERDAAVDAEASSRRATFLAAEARRLTESLDERATLQAMARLSLPRLDAWCILDVLDADGTMYRAAIIHPDPAKQAMLRVLEGRWTPRPGDPFGAPAAQRSAGPILIAENVDSALGIAAHDPDTLRILRSVGVGPLLTVPLLVRERLIGAVTFVGGPRDEPFTSEDVALAVDLAIRSALALDNARMHSEAVALRRKAESANQAKSDFLGTMSHELRTPLNAIGGYVDLIDMGLRGPVSEAQHADLERIRLNQQHLSMLVTDILNFVRLGSGQMSYDVEDINVRELLERCVAMVEPLLIKKQLVVDELSCDRSILLRADRKGTMQILVNLLSNAIKFTPPGGHLSLGCLATHISVDVYVSDSGIGIPEDKIELIFQPFVQVRNELAGRDNGVGLGLAISRDLARAMGGDLTVHSVEGAGSTFTLKLPTATP